MSTCAHSGVTVRPPPIPPPHPSKEIAREVGHGAADRLTTDLTGPYYRMVMESTHESLAAFEESMGSIFKYDKWREWYGKFTPLIESGSREIHNIVD